MMDKTEILQKLRALMKNLPNNQGSIDAYIIPTDDAHQSEYICEHDERRRFVTGFTGSAGTAVVTADRALLWTDGRYYLQATQEIDSNWTLMKDGLPGTPKIEEWLTKNLLPSSLVGADSNLLSSRAWRPIYQELDKNELKLKSIDGNLIDLIWNGQPAATSNRIIMLGIDSTGKTIGDKVTEIRAEMVENKVSTLVITALDEVAWLLNLRGSDIDYNPVFFAYVIITIDNVHFFVDKLKLPAKYETHFNRNNIDVTVHDYEQIKTVLHELAQKSTQRVWIWLGSSQALTALIPPAKLYEEITPIAKMKAIKNSTEAQGMIDCHVRDGVALCKYFAWVERCLENNQLVTEISGANKLEQFRKKMDKFMGLSFPTISSSGENGAIIHYTPNYETNRPINKSEIYLCDSGAQYLDGTTDVTRTWHFGTPTDYQMDCYTRVLKGQITLATTVFPQKVKGQVLDTLARKALWDVGLDYRHGTGHGIGHFLNVHEGPMGIGIRPYPDDPGLQANMFVSNEPGYYEDGEFGIRIEDIVQIVPCTVKGDFNGRGALTFKTITMCPIQTKMIRLPMLTDRERTHLNAYHERVFDTVGKILKAEADLETLEWLRIQTNPL